MVIPYRVIPINSEFEFQEYSDFIDIHEYFGWRECNLWSMVYLCFFVIILCRGGAASPCNSHHQAYSFLVGDPYKLSFATVAGWRSTPILLFGSQNLLSHNFRDFRSEVTIPNSRSWFLQDFQSFPTSRSSQSLGGILRRDVDGEAATALAQALLEERERGENLPVGLVTCQVFI